MSDEGDLTEPGRTVWDPAGGERTDPNRKKVRPAVLIGAVALGLLGAGGVIAYSTYTQFDLTLQGLQTAYTAEQTAAKRLARKGEALSKAVEQALARVKALEEGLKASEGERGRLEARNTKLETELKGLQTAYAAEQATATRLAQKAEELSKASEEAQARARTLEAGLKASDQQKSALEARSAKLETNVQALQTAQAAEQDTAKKLAQKAEELSRALELAHARMKAREEKPADLTVLNYLLGTNYSKRGLNEEARNAFETALKFDPNHAESHFELARLYLGHFDNKQAAAQHLRRYLELKPAAKDIERVKGWLMKVDKELEADKERQDYGKMELKRGLQRIFE
jgi:chromosome segregation ATPase